MVAWVERIESPAELDLLADKVLDAHSLAEMGLSTNEHYHSLGNYQ